MIERCLKTRMYRGLLCVVWLVLGAARAEAAELANPDWVGGYQTAAWQVLWGTDGAVSWRNGRGGHWQSAAVGERPIESLALDPQSGWMMALAEGRLYALDGKSGRIGLSLAEGWAISAVHFDAQSALWSAWGCEEQGAQRCAVLQAREVEADGAVSWQVREQSVIQGWHTVTVAQGHAVTTDGAAGVFFSEEGLLKWRRLKTGQDHRYDQIIYWRRAGKHWLGMTRDAQVLFLDPRTARAHWLNVPAAATKSAGWNWTAADQDPATGQLLLGASNGRIAEVAQGRLRFIQAGGLPAQRIVQLQFDKTRAEWLLLSNDGALFTSRDAGRTWSQTANLGPARPRAALLTEDGAGLIWGNGGLLASRRAGQQAWVLEQPDLSRYMHALSLTPSGGVLAVGAQGLVARAADGEALARQAWRVIDAGLGYHQYMLDLAAFPGGQTWVAAGSAATIIRSADAGQSWQTVFKHEDGAKGNFQRVAIHPHSQVALVVANPGWVMRSRDGGLSWQAVDDEVRHLNDVVALPEGGFVAAGRDGALLVFDRQGDYQRRIPTPAEANWFNLRLTQDGLWVLGEAPVALRFSRDLASMATLSLPRRHLLRDVFTDDTGVVLLAGADGTLLRSTDKGASWQPAAQVPASNYRRLLRLADGSLWTAGRDGVVLRSRDLGQSWQQVPSGTGKHFKSMEALPDGQGVLLYGERLVRLRQPD